MLTQTGIGRAIVLILLTTVGCTSTNSFNPSYLIALAANASSHPSAPSRADTATSSPIVVSITSSGATDQICAGPIAIQFSQPIDPATLTTSNVLITDGSGAPITGSITYDNTTNTATFVADTAALSNVSSCKVSVTESITTTDGVSIATNLSVSFSNGPTSIVSAPPVIVNISPSLGAFVSPGITPIVLTFSGPLDINTLTTANIYVTDWTGQPVAGALVYDQATNTVTFLPTASLNASTLYLVTITPGVQSLTGTALLAPFVYFFITGLPAPATPTVVSILPGLIVSADWFSPVLIRFSEAMMASTITTTNIVVTDSTGTVVPGAIIYDPITNTAIFTPTVLLNAGTTYVVTVSPSVISAAGVALAASVTASLVAALPDWLTPPSPCGNQICATGQVCCNASCGICTPPGYACIQIACASPM